MIDSIFLLAIGWIIITLFSIISISYFAKMYGAGFLIALYTGLVSISIVTATKLINFGHFDYSNINFFVPAGVIVYSISFLITDFLSEIYGEKEAQTAVWSGLFVMILFFIYSYITVKWPSAPFWKMQQSYENILGLSGRIAIASAISFIISQFIDVFIFGKLKKRHGEKWLWLRNNVSTWISQFFDTVVFMTIAFYGIFPITDLILIQYIIKIIIAFLDTPFVYLGRSIITKNSSKN